MALLGSLLYPDNPEMEKELNEKNQQLINLNNLHNTLVNSYRAVGEKTKTFDSYLMALTVLHYQMVYASEDLANLPDVDLPSISENMAQKVLEIGEEVGVLAMTLKMGYSGFKAVGNRVSNLFKQSGTVKVDRVPDESGDLELTENLNAEATTTFTREPIVNSGNVDMLTTSDPKVMSEVGTEMKSVAAEIKVASEEAELQEVGNQELQDAGTQAEEITETTEQATQTTSEADAAAEGMGATAILGVVVLVMTVVSEVLGVIHAAEDHAKLKKAEKQLDDLLKKSKDSLTALKNTFIKLLKVAKQDIENYNKVLAELITLEGSAERKITFSVEGINTFISDMPKITPDNAGVAGFQSAANTNIDAALADIREQVKNDGKMAQGISLIKTHMQAKKQSVLADDDPYLSELADVLTVDLKTVVIWNKFRVYLQTFASYLIPYHEQIKEATPAGQKYPSLPKKAKFNNKPDPNYQPDPNKFTIP